MHDPIVEHLAGNVQRETPQTGQAKREVDRFAPTSGRNSEVRREVVWGGSIWLAVKSED